MVARKSDLFLRMENEVNHHNAKPTLLLRQSRTKCHATSFMHPKSFSSSELPYRGENQNLLRLAVTSNKPGSRELPTTAD
jgi:hypothetical protein